MPFITLELLAEQSLDYGEPESIVLDLVSHVHKRIERFIYNQDIRTDSVPIAYLENPPLDSRVNLQIVNRTHSVPANSTKQTAKRSPYAVVTGAAYSAPYKEVAATNQTFVDERGKTRPLFFRHVLPDNVTECSLYILTRGNKHTVDTGYRVDLETSSIFTNYRNFYNADTGAYRLFFVVCSDEDGEIQHQLLNPIPVAKLADWQDIDLDTGRLTTDYPVYSRERSGGGYTFYFGVADTWYIKFLDRGLLQPRRPIGQNPDDPWFLRFTDGDVTAVVNGKARRYYTPEYNFQPFVPSKPFVLSTYNKMLRVNRNIINATRDSLAIDPTTGRHIEIFIDDVDGNLVKALTTDQGKDGTRFSDTDVFYESDKIVSWDNQEGFIALGLQLHRSWDIRANYYYKADDYEYTFVSLNPLNNKKMFDYTWVFYAIPDVNPVDRAIHHLVVDEAGIIIDASQPNGITYPSLQLRNSDTTFNTNTVIGLKYISDIETDTFITRYTAGFQNDNGYMILAEVTGVDVSIEEDQFEVDVRRNGAVLRREDFEAAVRANPKILQSILAYGEDGQIVPENAVMVLKAPLTLLEEYGGLLSQEDAERLLRLHIPSAVYPIIDWEFPRSELTGYSTGIQEITLDWTWEGPGYTYRVYRKTNIIGEFELIHTEVSPAEGVITFIDLGLNSGEVYHYAVTIDDGVNEYPNSNELAAMVQ
jgi:hypothetical protein